MSLTRFSNRASSFFLALSTALTPVGLAAIASTPSCLFGSGGPSAVGQGKKYVSGDPNFDDFFNALFELQVELAKSPQEEKEIRRELAKKLKGDPDASGTLLAKRADKRAKELASNGIGLKMEVSGLDEGDEPSAKVTTVGKDPSGDDKEFVDAVQKAAEAELKLVARLRKGKREIERLRGLSMALDQQVDAAFRLGGPSKKSEVRKNLNDARTLMPLMGGRADEVIESARTTVKKLEEAMHTDDGSFNKPPPPPPPPETPPENGEDGPDKPHTDKPHTDKPKPHTDKPKPPPSTPPTPPKPPPSDFEP